MPSIRLVCFDMDGTLIRQNSWYVLNQALGITTEEDAAMYEAYGRGELSYEDWVARLVFLYKTRGKASRENIEAALFAYELADGAAELVQHLQKRGYQSALVSGSFHVLVEHVAKSVGIEHCKGNAQILFDAQQMLSDVSFGGDEPLAKLGYAKEIAQQLGVPLSECACVGDGINDIPLFQATGKGITFTDAPADLKDAAWKVVSNLSEIQNAL